MGEVKYVVEDEVPGGLVAEWAVVVGGSNDREYFEDEQSEIPTKTAFGPPTTTD